jgi:hypothetical protein
MDVGSCQDISHYANGLAVYIVFSQQHRFMACGSIRDLRLAELRSRMRGIALFHQETELDYRRLSARALGHCYWWDDYNFS